jgi:Fe2+ or Zn2+ uptake regulation protein
MHSQVSQSNLAYFIEEDRLRRDLDADALRERYEQASGALVVCNHCGTIREVETT